MQEKAPSGVLSGIAWRDYYEKSWQITIIEKKNKNMKNRKYAKFTTIYMVQLKTFIRENKEDFPSFFKEIIILKLLNLKLILRLELQLIRPLIFLSFYHNMSTLWDSYKSFSTLCVFIGIMCPKKSHFSSNPKHGLY